MPGSTWRLFLPAATAEEDAADEAEALRACDEARRWASSECSDGGSWVLLAADDEAVEAAEGPSAFRLLLLLVLLVVVLLPLPLPLPLPLAKFGRSISAGPIRLETLGLYFVLRRRPS